MQKYNVAVVGATGLVGSMVLKVLEEYNFPINNLFLFASIKSIGKKVLFKNDEITIKDLTEDCFVGVDFAFFSAGSEVSKKWCVVAEESGAIVIDNTSFFRMHNDIALIVPEINIESFKGKRKLIANPNCSTIQSVLCLNAIKKFNPLKIIYTTFQAVSGSGIKGILDLDRCKEGKDNNYYPYNISKTCRPQIDSFLTDGYTLEEHKMINETKKILNMPNLLVTATCVRVPIMYCHGVSVVVEFEREINLNMIKTELSNQDGVVVLDDINIGLYPTSIAAINTDVVYVGRIKKGFNNNTISFYCVADNVRRGAASNAVLIALKIIEIYKIKSIA